eukprot:TRINITY_DN6884_c0_g2_i1.p1 TRINITY_DN6884_c0_g2~~TRINITY_DN6884_c0_g2_i1.p1  ORF type:complete len:273 (+),score=-15.53 TRINITY_DN6884_c0_g2_i1:1210-2028(+)
MNQYTQKSCKVKAQNDVNPCWIRCNKISQILILKIAVSKMSQFCFALYNTFYIILLQQNELNLLQKYESCIVVKVAKEMPKILPHKSLQSYYLFINVNVFIQFPNIKAKKQYQLEQKITKLIILILEYYTQFFNKLILQYYLLNQKNTLLVKLFFINKYIFNYKLYFIPSQLKQNKQVYDLITSSQNKAINCINKKLKCLPQFFLNFLQPSTRIIKAQNKIKVKFLKIYPPKFFLTQEKIYQQKMNMVLNAQLMKPTKQVCTYKHIRVKRSI